MTVSTLIAVIEPERSQEFFAWLADRECTVRGVNVADHRERGTLDINGKPMQLRLVIDFSREEDAVLCLMFWPENVHRCMTEEEIAWAEIEYHKQFIVMQQAISQRVGKPIIDSTEMTFVEMVSIIGDLMRDIVVMGWHALWRRRA